MKSHRAAWCAAILAVSTRFVAAPANALLAALHSTSRESHGVTKRAIEVALHPWPRSVRRGDSEARREDSKVSRTKRRRKTVEIALHDGRLWRQSWRDSLVWSNRALVTLLVERDAYAYFVKCTRTDTPQGTYILTAGSRWYEHFVAASIRRQVDLSDDSHSLLRILNEIAAHGYHALDYVGAAIDLKMVREDRRQLIAAFNNAVLLANREIAHATKIGINQSERPSIDEMHSCAKVFESIATRYSAILSGAALIKTDEAGGYIPAYLAGTRFEDMEPTPGSIWNYFGLTVPERGHKEI